ncbi:MAG: flagellar M-ring protein FliF [Cryptosporangiaceae bacterium]|nr:flagellar M-ring protein FliF [Cryptosporangiaceae bacterium]
MRDKLLTTLRRITGMFASFTAGQKAVTIFAVLAIIIGGYFFATWASKPALAPLYSNLAAADASAVVDKLAAGGVTYELANGGQTIMVPQDQVYNLRLQMSGAGLPAQSDSGYALLDKQGVTTSDFMQQIGYQRAMETELANTIKAIDGVKLATVHLAIPKKDIFSADSVKPTASVLVGTVPGKSLTQSQVDAIVHLVASSIEGLDADQVTVADATGKILAAGGKTTGASGAGDAQSQQTGSFESRMGSSVQAMLEQVVGPGHAHVSVTADLDFDQTETKTLTYTQDPKIAPLSETHTAEGYSGGGTGSTGVLGPDNISVPSGTGTGSYSKTSETKDNAIGSIIETRKAAPGKVRRLGVAVVLDQATAKNLSTAQVEKLVSSAVGLDTTRGDTLAVSTMSFDQSAAKAAASDLAAADQAAKQGQMLSMAKTGAMIGGILLLVLFALFRGRRKKKTGLTAAEKAQLREAQEALAEARARASAALEAAPELPALEMASSPDIDPVLEGQQREIAAMVERQPDEVAIVLRSWLADQRTGASR